MDKKFAFQTLGLFIVIIVAMFFVFNQSYLKGVRPVSQPKQNQNIAKSQSQQRVKIVDDAGGVKAEVLVDLANTAETRAKGLSGRASMATTSGMLFIHDAPAKYTYWMKNMQIPIDMIWILNNQVVDIIENIPTPIPGQTDETLERYAPIVEANRVLETNAGFVTAHGIKTGDKIVVQSP